MRGVRLIRLTLLVLLAATIVAGCANPIMQVTHDRYLEAGLKAEARGNLAQAEELYNRAAWNARHGHLDPETEATSLYLLGSVKRQLEKFEEAELLLKQALVLEERLSGPESPKTARIVLDLAANYGGQGKFSDGVPFVTRLLPLADRFAGRERIFASRVFRGYADALRKSQQTAALSLQLETKAAALGVK